MNEIKTLFQARQQPRGQGAHARFGAIDDQARVDFFLEMPAAAHDNGQFQQPAGQGRGLLPRWKFTQRFRGHGAFADSHSGLATQKNIDVFVVFGVEIGERLKYHIGALIKRVGANEKVQHGGYFFGLEKTREDRRAFK